MALSGTFTGWHRYVYPRHKYETCSDDECAKQAPGKFNYYKCKACRDIQWFESKINTFKSGTL